MGIPEKTGAWAANNWVIGDLGAGHSVDVNTATETIEEQDQLLVCRLHAGDQRAAMRLLDRHVRTIRRYFVNKVRRAADVDVLVGGVVKSMLGPSGGFRNARRFAAHLFAVQQTVLRQYYGRGESTRGSIAEFGGEVPTWREPGAACNRMLIALRGLPLPHQEVLELLYWEDLAMAELAAILEVPISMAASRVRAAKAMLLVSLGMHAEDQEQEDLMLAAVDSWGRGIGERLVAGRPG